MLLRHTVESNSVKQAIMAKEITHVISSHGRARQSDLPSFADIWFPWPGEIGQP